MCHQQLAVVKYYQAQLDDSLQHWKQAAEIRMGRGTAVPLLQQARALQPRCELGQVEQVLPRAQRLSDSLPTHDVRVALALGCAIAHLGEYLPDTNSSSTLTCEKILKATESQISGVSSQNQLGYMAWYLEYDLALAKWADLRPNSHLGQDADAFRQRARDRLDYWFAHGNHNSAEQQIKGNRHLTELLPHLRTHPAVD